jgi:hypothetical protein
MGRFDFHNKDNNKIIISLEPDLYNKNTITFSRFDQYKYKRISSVVTSKYQQEWPFLVHKSPSRRRGSSLPDLILCAVMLWHTTQNPLIDVFG